MTSLRWLSWHGVCTCIATYVIPLIMTSGSGNIRPFGRSPLQRKLLLGLLEEIGTPVLDSSNWKVLMQRYY